MTVPTVISSTTINPVRYEIFAHRLWAIGEEGRIALQRVTASPIVAQGGECMSSFYDANGTMILACSGHLRFAAATSDAIKKMIEWYEDDPGIHEGDEFFFNDPYIAGSHTYDVMQIAPIFWEGRRVAWVASSSHTADTGGVLRGGATEIFHEGIRILGLKIVEGGVFRQDVFKTIVEQCRDPHYVGMDIKSRTAANNVCVRGYRTLIETFAIDFVEAAGQKMINDAETLAREKLRSIPDGTWRSRSFGSTIALPSRKSETYQILCSMTKQDDELSIDFTGSSPQLGGDQNSTLPSTLAHVSIALTNHLFWDIPWSDGRFAPLTVIVPEGSVLHCRFPAACGRAPSVGNYVVAAVAECIAKMLFAAGLHEDVNASWGSFWYGGGPGYFYGGHNARGLPNPQGLYDVHGGGLGATPTRDGVPTGGNMNIPSGGISDIERTELQYPFLYFTRNHNPDGGGYGRYNGGPGSARLLKIHGSKDVSVDFLPYGGLPNGAFGLFGGYPAGTGGIRALLEPTAGMEARLAAGDYSRSATDAVDGGVAAIRVPEGNPARIAVPENYLLSDFTQGGGGYGDPLDRDPALVRHDIRRRHLTARTAEQVFGVVLDAQGGVDLRATDVARAAIREARRADSRPPLPAPTIDTSDWKPVSRFHEVLELGSGRDQVPAIRCRRCEQVLCGGDQNYKEYALRRDIDLQELAGRRLPDGTAYRAVFREYACPGCATLLQTDVYCPALGGEEDLWDIRLAL